jgi:uncharacterized repeat protein (TIGR03803 family)
MIMDSAGNLYGTTRYGRTSKGSSNPGAGTIFKLDASKGYAPSTLLRFDGTNGGFSMTGVIMDKEGNLYGTTEFGPISKDAQSKPGHGTVFKLDASKGYALTTLVAFPGAYDARQKSGLVMDAEGNLYGPMPWGGPSDYGTIFKLDASQSCKLSTLVAFNGPTAHHPDGLMMDGAGNFYGAAGDTVFKLDGSKGYEFSALFKFDKSNGWTPADTMIIDAAGNLYGTTERGGPTDDGTVFKLVASKGYAISTLATFNQDNGQQPRTRLAMDGAGNIFGTTPRGGANGLGTVFKLDAAHGYTLSTLFNFSGPDGFWPEAGLTIDAAGNLFGTTTAGGDHREGTVFELSPVHELASTASAPARATSVPAVAAMPENWTTIPLASPTSQPYTLKTLFNFAPPDGKSPYSSLCMDAAGNLYGATREGGGYMNEGEAFKLDASKGYAFSKLLRFTSPRIGSPSGGFIMDSAGNLYGAAGNSGRHSAGTVFKFDASNAYASSILVNFDGSSGAVPSGRLTMDKAGNFYGTASVPGGPYKIKRTIFKLDAFNGYALSTLLTFGPISPGQIIGAEVPLIVDGAGNLYGVTYNQTTTGGGAVFKLDASNGYAFSTLAGFATHVLICGLIMDAAGNLYGATDPFGSRGSVFKLDASRDYAVSTLANFTEAGAATGDLAMDAACNIFGTTYNGGPGHFGTIFKLDASRGYALETLARFETSNGAYPQGLIMDGAGNIFGTTHSGGTDGYSGTVFKLSPVRELASTTSVTFGTAGAPVSTAKFPAWPVIIAVGVIILAVGGVIVILKRRRA